MKYNLEKEIKQQMERYETDIEETSIIFEYPDPAKTELQVLVISVEWLYNQHIVGKPTIM